MVLICISIARFNNINIFKYNICKEYYEHSNDTISTNTMLIQ